MRKIIKAITALILSASVLTACGSENAGKTTEQPLAATATPTATTEPTKAPETTEAPETPANLTEDEAYTAVINYNKAIGSGITGETNSEGYTEYFSVSTNEDGKIVVLYRSYTAAQIRYYVDPVTGDTYVTEFVPGITDDEQPNGETFNAREYLTVK